MRHPIVLARATRLGHLLALLAIAPVIASAPAARAADTDGNGIDDSTEIALARRFCPALALHGPDTALHPITVPVYPVPVEIMGLGGAQPGEGLTADRLFVLWRAEPYDYPYGDHWVQAAGWSPPLPEGDPLHDYGALRDDPPERRHLAPPAQPFGPYNLRFHWEYGNPAVNEPEEWYDVWQNGNAWTRPGSTFPPTAYAHLRRCEDAGCSAGAVLIQYWFFFPFNDWVNNHEGDWEGINVIVSSADSTTASLADVEYFAHRVNIVRPAYAPLTEHCLVVDGSHPVAFVGGHGYLQGCTGGTGQGEASHGFYPTPGRFEEVGEGDFLGCFERADEEIAVDAGPAIHWSDLEVEIIPDPAAIDTAAEPARAWLVADLLWGTRRVPSVGGELWEDVGNFAPHGPAYNLEGRWGRVAAQTATRAYSRPQDPHSRPYRPADLAWTPHALFIDCFTRMTENEPGSLGAWTLGAGAWWLDRGGLMGTGDGSTSLANRAFFSSPSPPAWYTLPLVAWNERAARFATDVALADSLPADGAVGIIAAGAGEEIEHIQVVLRRLAGAEHALEIRVRTPAADSLVAGAAIAAPGVSSHRLEVLTVAPDVGGLFHDVEYDGVLVLESIATPGERDPARGLLADGAARARFDRVSFSALRLEPRFRHPPFATFTAGPAPGADIYACPQLLTWIAVDEKRDDGIAEQVLALSIDGGTSWMTLATLAGDMRSATWLPPEVAEPHPAQLRLTISDVEGDQRTIRTPHFWLRPGIPAAAIIAPSGGEAWRRSTAELIQWSAPCRGPVDLRLSTDGGATFPHLIASEEPNDGSLIWSIPDYLPQSARCRVELAAGGSPLAASPADFALLGDGQLAGGDFEHPEPWTLTPVVAHALGAAATVHGIGAPPIPPPLEGSSSLFAHARAAGTGGPGARDASFPARAGVELRAESEQVSILDHPEIRSLHFQLRALAEVGESPGSQAAAAATAGLEVVYRDAAGVELAVEEIAMVRIERDAPGTQAEDREEVAPLPWAPAGAVELGVRVRLEARSEALVAGALAASEALADGLWFAIPIGVAGDRAGKGVSDRGSPWIRIDPNPAPAGAPVRIAFALPGPGPATLTLYDAAGRLRARFVSESGERRSWEEVQWIPPGLPAGVYFWRLESEAGLLAACKWITMR